MIYVFLSEYGNQSPSHDAKTTNTTHMNTSQCQEACMATIVLNHHSFFVVDICFENCHATESDMISHRQPTNTHAHAQTHRAHTEHKRIEKQTNESNEKTRQNKEELGQNEKKKNKRGTN
jgi:hypothetical protein